MASFAPPSLLSDEAALRRLAADPQRDILFARHVLPRLLRVPRVRRDPHFVFHVAGANKLPDAILALNNSMYDGVVRVIVHGHVPELRPLYIVLKAFLRERDLD